MSLSQPSKRKLLHTRQLTFDGYQRDDGLFDIEGHLVDRKSYSFPNIDRGGTIEKGESLHEMRVRVTLDDALLIHAAEAVTEWAPYATCPGGAESFSQLKGQQIGPGWNRKVREILGGTKGCTHITEMLAQLATTAIQTLYSVRQEKNTKPEVKAEKPLLLNSCHSYASHSPVVARQWPKYYDGE